MELISNGVIKHKGKWYGPGEKITQVKKDDGERLIEFGVARPDEEAEKRKAEEMAKKKAEDDAKANEEGQKKQQNKSKDKE
ncbi:hypothetical protein HF072_07425 [Bacillus sp. RO3]|nr:hypothetical protein [Bacillus sp. RO3]